jgi:hypothetical protein
MENRKIGENPSKYMEYYPLLMGQSSMTGDVR